MNHTVSVGDFFKSPKWMMRALSTTLNPSNYTAIVRGAHGTTGVALVEGYTLR